VILALYCTVVYNFTKLSEDTMPGKAVLAPNIAGIFLIVRTK
jgi:hypothetical protein